VLPGCNAARGWDERFFGRAHMLPPAFSPLLRSEECSSCSPGSCPRDDAPQWCSSESEEGIFDPAGLVPSIASLLVGVAGVAYGLVLVHESNHRSRVVSWVWPSLFLVVLAVVLHVTSPSGSLRRINASVASPSFVALMVGVNGSLLAMVYAIVEGGGPTLCRKARRGGRGKSSLASSSSSAALRSGVTRGKRLLRPLICVGMNSLLVYILSSSGSRVDKYLRAMYWSARPPPEPSNLVDWFRHDVLQHTLHMGADGAALAFAMVKMVVWTGIGVILAKRGTFWKL